jgi:hypothetical protein
MYAKKPFDAAPLIQKKHRPHHQKIPHAAFEDIDFFDFGSMGLFA